MLPRVPRRRRQATTPRRHDHRHAKMAKLVQARGGGCAFAWKGGCHGPLEADHVLPLALGGTSTLDNYRLLCERHNRQGGAQVAALRRKLGRIRIVRGFSP